MLYFAEEIAAQPYDESLLIYEITEDTDYEFMCGSENGIAYTVKASRQNSNWKMSLGDFISYNKDKNILLIMSKDDFEESKKAYGTHTHRDRFLRENEGKVLVHSTTYENFLSILKDGFVKSYNKLKSDSLPIGTLLGDPADFRDYIMFSNGGISGEIVVSSKEKGEIVMDTNIPYETGARLYFDAQKAAENGLLIRDGIHLKVKDELPLKQYLLWAATWENVGLKSRVSTPEIFTEKANAKFRELFPEYESF